MKITFILVAVLAMAAIGLVSCQQPGAEPTEKLGVVASIMPLAEFVENVGGEKVAVAVMVPPGANPHTYEPTPSQMVKVSQAEMFIKVGSGVEFELAWMDKLIAVNEKMLVVDSSQGIVLRRETLAGEDHHDIDPHIWLSPLNAKITIHNIFKGLVQVDPGNESYYTQNRDTYLEKLDSLDKDIRDGLANVENRAFIVFHPAWGYFATEYNLTQLTIEVSGKEPSAQDIANLIEGAKEHNIRVVFASPQFNPESARVIAKEIGGRVVFIDSLAKDYISNLRLVLGEMAQAME